MSIKLSFSKIRTYQTCPRKYKLQYIDKLSSKEYKSYFAFGTAIDLALNHLLETKDLEESIKRFDKSFRYNFVNGEGTYLPTYHNIVYAKTDFDKDLLLPEDLKTFSEHIKKLIESKDQIKEILDQILDRKEQKGFQNLSIEDRQNYALANWLSLRRKGHIMIKSYNKKVIPKIKDVISIQGRTKLENQDGDVVNGVLDLVFTWEDGKNYLGDNKTSAIEYKSDSAELSPQLIGYYHSSREKFNLSGVCFFVMYKNILKNKTKICEKCGKDGSGQRHKTCDADIKVNLDATNPKTERCNGAWIETLDPDCHIDVILSEVPQTSEDLVLESFDESLQGIKNEYYPPNLFACRNGNLVCEFFSSCWKGDNSGLIKMEKKK